MRALVSVLVLWLSVVSAQSAQFWQGTIRGWPALKITGPILPEDYGRFIQETTNKPFLIVQLTSEGGNAYAAVQMGRTIQDRKYSTLVANDDYCFSACAIMWLGGNKRFMGQNARIGFHAVYDKNDHSVVSDGNALVGAYYGQLHLSDAAIQWLTSAPPETLSKFTPVVAQTLGIEIFPALQADTIVYSNAPSAITPPVGTVSLEPVSPAPQPPMNAYAPPSPQPSPSQTLYGYPQTQPPAVVADAPFTDEEVSAAHRLGHAFANRRVYGLPALRESVDQCYRQAVQKQSATSAEYCIGLDALSAMFAADLAQKALGVPPDYFAQPQVRTRISSISPQIGGNDLIIRRHALQMVKIAFADIQTDASAVAQSRVNPDPCAEMGGAENPFYGLCKAFAQ